MDTMKLAYFELGLIFLLSLRRGLTLLGVVRFPGASWFEFPVSPSVIPGPSSASLDVAKFPAGVESPAAAGVCSATVTSPTAGVLLGSASLIVSIS